MHTGQSPFQTNGQGFAYSSTQTSIPVGGATRPSNAWQFGGYHGEHTELDDLEGVNQENDHGYIPAKPSAQVDASLDPFHDFAVDPSIADARSESLRGHVGMFWMDENERVRQAKQKSAQEAQGLQKLKNWMDEERGFLRGLMLVVVIVAIALTCVRWFILSVRNVEVSFTNQELQVEKLCDTDREILQQKMLEVVDASGIHKGMNILFLNEESIKENIERNPFLIMVGMETHLPGQVSLRVRRRAYEAYITSRGIVYLVDREGMVLSETDDLDTMPAYVEIAGLNVDGCGAGQRLPFQNQEQQEIFRDILVQIEAMQLKSDIRKVYVNDLQNLSLLTRDGFSVRLGGNERLHAKLRAMILVLDYLRNEESRIGTVDVSIPETPTYIPENTV